VSDIWADWIRTRRTGGDAVYEARMLEHLAGVRDRVLENAGLEDGQTLLDVGCGNGLIGFGALERGAGEVVFSDVSAALLEDCRALASVAAVDARCGFVEAAATNLEAVASRSVDVVTTRSVLIYVEDKERAFSEFHRVLRPGGRLSIFEPINRFGMNERRCTWGYDVDGAEPLMRTLTAVYEEAPNAVPTGTGVSVSPRSVSTGPGTVTVSITGTIADDSEVSGAEARLRQPDGTVLSAAMTRASGSPANGLWTATVGVPYGSPGGTYTSQVVATDDEGAIGMGAGQDVAVTARTCVLWWCW